MSKWVTIWGNATSIANRKVESYSRDLTLRYPITCPFAGDKMRLHFSNFCGTEPVTLAKVTVAKDDGFGGVDGDFLEVNFSGKSEVTIGAGEEIFSDEFNFSVNRLTRFFVSIYLKDFTQMRSAVVITGPYSGGYFSLGDQTRTVNLDKDITRNVDTYYFLTGIDLWTADRNRAIICYGDSITAQDWPDLMLEKCLEREDNDKAIIRRAASGTRILREYTCIRYESYGLSGEHRFERELSSVSGADSVIIQQGINDIIHPVGTDVNIFRPMSDLPTVEELERGMEYYLGIAKAHNLKVFLGTLLPIYGWRTYAPFREELRNKFNDWMRSRRDIAGVIDFDLDLCDREDMRKFKAENDSGDHLHPSKGGYRRMAYNALEKVW